MFCFEALTISINGGWYARPVEAECRNEFHALVRFDSYRR